jgi:hypothetical protein
VDLVYSEILLREEGGEAPTPDEYLRRFPDYAAVLGPQIELHRALAEEDAGLESSVSTQEESDGADAGRPRVPGYEILGELGRGGMSVVYQARQMGLNRVVALKVILAGAFADPEQQRRFRAEAKVIARLRHPNIIQVHDCDVHGACPYLALEFVEGGTLAQKTAGNSQPPGDAARTVETLALAVHHAHGAGLVHRDLKPANVLLTADDVLKITDFGLTKQLTSEAGVSARARTGNGAILGTPSYMAPEQVANGRGAVGPAADIWALGVILYELLTGRPPFQGNNVLEVLRQVQEQEPLPPTRLRAGLPRDLETICLKCLHKEQGRRYATAAALAEDLRRFQAGEPILARPVGVTERTWRWCRRNPWLAGMSGVVGLLLLILVVGSLATAWRMNQVAARATRAETDATNRLFDALVTRAEAGRTSKRPGQRFAGLEALRQAAEIARVQGRPAADLVRLRNDAVACLALPDLRREQEWEGNPPETNGLAFDADFQRYAWSLRDEGIRVCRLADHAELFRLPTPPSDRVSRWTELRFSPDGRHLAA